MPVELFRPIEYSPLPSQQRFHDSRARVRGFSGPIGCLAGETIISGRSVAEWVHRGVGPIVDTLLGPIQAGVPFVKGRCELYKVKLDSGASVTVTLDHLLFSFTGWVKIESLFVGARVLSALQVPFQTNSGAYLLGCRTGASSLSRRLSSSTDYYSSYRHQCGGQLQMVEDGDQYSVPLRVDALERIQQNWREDGTGQGPGCSHFYRESFRHANRDSQGQSDPIYYAGCCGEQDKPSHACYSSLFDDLSQTSISLLTTTEQLTHDYVNKNRPSGLTLQNPSAYSNYAVQWDAVTSIKYERTDYFFDLHVPIAEHYIAHGMVHHNSGKSAALAQEALRLCVENPGLPGLIGAPTFPMLRDASQKAFFEVLDHNSIPYVFWKSENRAVLTDWGSEVWFRSLDNPERLRGTNLAWIGVDELTYCTEAAWLRLIGRLRHPDAKNLSAFAVWTPKGYEWVYKWFISAEKKAGYEAILAEPRENSYLPADFYDSLSRVYDSKFFQQEVEGVYLSQTGNRVYYAFDRAASVKPLEYVPNGELFWSLDFNVNPMCSVIAQIEDLTTRYDTLMNRKNARLNVIDEIVLPDANIGEACNEFVRRTERWAAQGQLVVQLYGDASGGARTHAGPSSWQLVMEYFRNKPEYKMVKRVPQANPHVKDRVNSMNAMLLNNSGERRLMVDPRCKELIADFEQVQWNSDSAGNQTADLSKKDPKRSHVSDSCGYVIYGQFPIRQRVELQKQSIYGIS